MRPVGAAWLLAVSLWGGDLRVGRASLDITPPAGMPMGGYFEIRLNAGTHDPLLAKALVLEQAGVRAALVACDVESLPRSLAGRARELAEKITGIPADHVLISATHTHTGPEMSHIFLDRVTGPAANIARGYQASLPAKVAEAVRAANAGLLPARAWAAMGREDSIAFNRRFLMKDGSVRAFPDKSGRDVVRAVGPTDPSVPVVYFDTPEGEPLATLVNFAMHLDDVGGLLYSADYPYMLARVLGEVKGPGMLTIFTIGTAGNIEQRDLSNPEPEVGQAEANRLGIILGGAVLKAYKGMTPVGGRLRVRRESVPLPVQEFEPKELERARQVVDRVVARGPEGMAFLDIVQAFKVLALADYAGRPIDAEVPVVALGNDLAWVGLPGEVFVELGLAIKNGSPFRYTIVNELTGDMIDYVPNRKAFLEGGYEAVNSRCRPGCGETLADAAVRLLVRTHAEQ